MILYLKGLALVLVLVLSAVPSFANVYEKGSLYCDDFQDAEELYQMEPDDKYYATGYVLCLFARGQGNDDALAMDIAENTATRFNDPNTAWLFARYVSTGGTFAGYDRRKLNEAIQAFARVWLFITETPHYPNGYIVTESAEQHTIYTIYNLTFLNYNRFIAGVRGV